MIHPTKIASRSRIAISRPSLFNRPEASRYGTPHAAVEGASPAAHQSAAIAETSVA
jgi:hypothetical protein